MGREISVNLSCICTSHLREPLFNFQSNRKPLPKLKVGPPFVSFFNVYERSRFNFCPLKLTGDPY